MREVYAIRSTTGLYYDGVNFGNFEGAAFFSNTEECEYTIATMISRGAYIIEKIYIKY